MEIGGTAKLKGSMFSTRVLHYAGMPTDQVFSLVVAWSKGNNSAAYNLYFPKDIRTFELFDGRVTVLHLTPTLIRLRYEK